MCDAVRRKPEGTECEKKTNVIYYHFISPKQYKSREIISPRLKYTFLHLHSVASITVVVFIDSPIRYIMPLDIVTTIQVQLAASGFLYNII